jgi:two-component system sensor histidine kinase/response regulator
MSHVVVIDDDLPLLDSIVETLRVQGFSVEAARNGREGIHLVHEQIPDLVVCDISMPELNGYDVLRSLRGDPVTRSIPFVFLTGKVAREDFRKGMELGADDFLPKPFRSSELLEAVNTQLQKRTQLAEQYETTLRLLRKNIVYALPHELRTPLTGMLGYAELLQMDAEVLQPEEVATIASHISTSSRRLHRIIENFLVYAQLELIASDPEQLEALRNHVIGHTANIIHNEAVFQAEAAGRADDLVVQADRAAVQISEADLRKIIAELVGNAFKFSKPGSRVLVTAGRDTCGYVIRICDNGRGMTAEQIQNIGAYMQFERVLHEQQGLGLGLIIAKRLIEFHAGHFAIRSVPGQGTEVVVTFAP